MHKNRLLTAALVAITGILAAFTMSGCVNIHVNQPLVRDGNIPIPMAGADDAAKVDPHMSIKPKDGTGAPGDVMTPSDDIEYR